MEEGKAATRIQASYRGRAARQRVGEMAPNPPRGVAGPSGGVPKPPVGAAKPPIAEDKAATKIQAAFRGKARSRLKRAPRPPAGISPPPGGGGGGGFASTPSTGALAAARQKLPPGVKPPKQGPKPGMRRGLSTAGACRETSFPRTYTTLSTLTMPPNDSSPPARCEPASRSDGDPEEGRGEGGSSRDKDPGCVSRQDGEEGKP